MASSVLSCSRALLLLLLVAVTLIPGGTKLASQGVTVVAAVSEELPRLASVARSGAAAVAVRRPPPRKVAVRAALTVRRKHKEDLKEAVAGHLGALWDMVGWGVVLELISTKIHPI